MEHVAPLIQTVLWVGLIGAIAWRFHNRIDALLDAVQKRIESGSPVKAGPIEIGAALRPQNSEQQKEKLNEEILEVKQEEKTIVSPASESMLRSRILQAEDFALRAIQEEFGAPISRQVQIGSDLQVDGVFIKKGRGYFIEVKYVDRVFSAAIIAQTAIRAASTFNRFNWKNVTLIIAVVFNNENINTDEESERIVNMLSNYKRLLEVRTYKFNELSKQYGLN